MARTAWRKPFQIKSEIFSLDTFTIPSSGYYTIPNGKKPSGLTAENLIATRINYFGSNSGAICGQLAGVGQWMLGTPGAKIDNCSIRYIYIVGCFRRFITYLRGGVSYEQNSISTEVYFEICYFNDIVRSICILFKEWIIQICEEYVRSIWKVRYIIHSAFILDSCNYMGIHGFEQRYDRTTKYGKSRCWKICSGRFLSRVISRRQVTA